MIYSPQDEPLSLLHQVLQQKRGCNYRRLREPHFSSAAAQRARAREEIKILLNAVPNGELGGRSLQIVTRRRKRESAPPESNNEYKLVGGQRI
jgi:hypothetical protein